jgi:hypothetical protein
MENAKWKMWVRVGGEDFSVECRFVLSIAKFRNGRAEVRNGGMENGKFKMENVGLANLGEYLAQHSDTNAGSSFEHAASQINEIYLNT